MSGEKICVTILSDGSQNLCRRARESKFLLLFRIHFITGYWLLRWLIRYFNRLITKKDKLTHMLSLRYSGFLVILDLILSEKNETGRWVLYTLAFSQKATFWSKKEGGTYLFYSHFFVRIFYSHLRVPKFWTPSIVYAFSWDRREMEWEENII